jgi:uncharacterized protein (TIGR00266 family)
MRVEIDDQGAFGHAMVYLDDGETFHSESGAMFRSSPTIDVDVTTRSRGKGGLLSGVKRLLAGDNFFFSTYEARGGAGEVGLAPVLQGAVREIPVETSEPWICAGGSYLASGPGLQVETQFQGLKGLFTGESLFFVEVSGQGPLLVSAFGFLEEIPITDGLIVDTGHVVAFTAGLEYTLEKAGGSWIQSWLAGEGVVLRFSGEGRVLVQSHNPKEFGQTVGGRLPARKG